MSFPHLPKHGFHLPKSSQGHLTARPVRVQQPQEQASAQQLQALLRGMAHCCTATYASALLEMEAYN